MDTREIDKAVAAKVLGWPEGERQKLHAAEGRTFYDGRFKHEWLDDYGPTTEPFSPSRSLSDAGLVLEKMREKGWYFFTQSQNDGYASFFYPVGNTTKRVGRVERSLELSICLAALAAVEEQPNG